MSQMKNLIRVAPVAQIFYEPHHPTLRISVGAKLKWPGSAKRKCHSNPEQPCGGNGGIAALWRFPSAVENERNGFYVFLAFHQTGVSTALGPAVFSNKLSMSSMRGNVTRHEAVN
jgi:hypothetical protein